MSNNFELMAGPRLISPVEVHAVAVAALGQDADCIDLDTPEALAALVRRASSFLAPCSHRLIRTETVRSLQGLTWHDPDSRQECSRAVDDIIESLTTYGDLLELPAEGLDELNRGRMLYLAPPSFVIVDGVVFLIGGQPDGVDMIPSTLRSDVEYRNHTRRLRSVNTYETADSLRGIGWIELPRSLWLPTPSRISAKQLVAGANEALARSSTFGDVNGLRVLDSEKSPTFYPDRWVELKRQSGRFVARREQRFGADLWSFVEVTNGHVTKLVDLPIKKLSPSERPCDAAWHLQMAIDAVCGRPQLYELRARPPAGSVILDFFSPIPLWARRKWEVLGDEVPRDRSLFAFRFPAAEFAEVERSLRDELWMIERVRHRQDRDCTAVDSD
jgi:hypothetical protein